MTQAQMELLPSAGTALCVTPKAVRSLEESLARIFPSPQAETRLQQARRIMGDEVCELSDAELTECISQFQYLIDQWLDEFERQTFDGKTLGQLVSGG